MVFLWYTYMLYSTFADFSNALCHTQGSSHHQQVWKVVKGRILKRVAIRFNTDYSGPNRQASVMPTCKFNFPEWRQPENHLYYQRQNVKLLSPNARSVKGPINQFKYQIPFYVSHIGPLQAPGNLSTPYNYAPDYRIKTDLRAMCRSVS